MMLVTTLPAVAAPTLILTSETDLTKASVSILDYADLVEDASGRLGLGDILSKQPDFHAVATQAGELEVHMSRTAYWFRVDVSNRSTAQDWYFVLYGSLSREVDVYLGNGDKQAGYRNITPLTHARGNQYLLPFQENSDYRVYFRVRDAHAPMLLAPQLKTPRQMLADVMLLYPIYSLMIGGLLTLAAYNLLYFFYLRDMSFLALSVFIVCFVAEMGNHAGVWHYFSWIRDRVPDIGAAFGLLAISAGISLVREWMETAHFTPRLDRLLRLGFWLCLFLIPVQYLAGYGAVMVGAVALPSIGLFAASAVLRYRQGFRFPLMLRAAAILFLVSMLPALLRSMGIIDAVPLLTDSTFFTLLLSLVMLSLTQAEQVHEKSEQAERVAIENKAKDEFLTTMSHELRTPMHAVVSAGRLLQDTSLNATQREYVARLNISSHHMLSLVNDILDLAKLESHLLVVEEIPFKLETVLHQVEQLLAEQAQNKHLRLMVENHYHPLNKQPLGDPTRLKQVLLNLTSNAIKFTLSGEVRLTVTPVEVTSESVTLLFEVQDSGIGIAPAQLGKLFQPFSQLESGTSRKFGGSGLGLAISKKLVRCMGGDIQVASNVGVGSCFSFELSLPLQPPEELENQEVTTEASLSGRSVLLVDDDEMNRFFGREILNSHGAAVTLASDGEEAIQCILAQDFDLVLMDISMPGMNGYETVRKIRENPRFQNLPIVALTAHVISGEAERCKSAGMNAYITKPFDDSMLKVLPFSREENN